MSPVFSIRCRKCGYSEKEHYFRTAKEYTRYDCPMCEGRAWEKLPEPTNWRFSDAMKSK
jgi:hypothetical protein